MNSRKVRNRNNQIYNMASADKSMQFETSDMFTFKNEGGEAEDLPPNMLLGAAKQNINIYKD